MKVEVVLSKRGKAMQFYSLAGHMALGSRLRRLAEQITNDAEKLYQLYHTDIDPRSFPVFYMLSIKGSAGITELADDIGQTHASVSQVVREMVKSGFAETFKDPDDGRVNKAKLTEKGISKLPNLNQQCKDIESTISEIFTQSGSNLWEEIESFEYELNKKGLYDRVNETRKVRESNNIEIVAFKEEYTEHFKQLNQAWIEEYWEMEECDHKALDNPKGNILDQGGYIAVALHNQKPVGTCALLKMGEGEFELAKMAVDNSVKGLGIGTLIGEHCLQQAKKLGANRVYLESNTQLTPALNLYRKLGFKRIPHKDSPYQRCNVQMELVLA